MQENNNNKTILANSFSATNWQISISGEIADPLHYTEELAAIRNASENDSIEIFLNTPGGNVNTAAQFVSAIKTTAATVIAHLESECHSAGTYIALSCDDIVIYDNAFMLIHNYSGGSWGKGDDSVNQALKTREWIRNMMSDMYVPFLTEEELDTVFDNNDIYLLAPEIKERWKLVVEHRADLAKKANDQLEQDIREKANNL